MWKGTWAPVDLYARVRMYMIWRRERVKRWQRVQQRERRFQRTWRPSWFHIWNLRRRRLRSRRVPQQSHLLLPVHLHAHHPSHHHRRGHQAPRVPQDHRVHPVRHAIRILLKKNSIFPSHGDSFCNISFNIRSHGRKMLTTDLELELEYGYMKGSSACFLSTFKCKDENTDDICQPGAHTFISFSFSRIGIRITPVDKSLRSKVVHASITCFGIGLWWDGGGMVGRYIFRG